MLPGKAAASWGMAAEDITITGLEHHEPDVLLAAIGVKPGASLIGFDAGASRAASSKASTGSKCQGAAAFPEPARHGGEASANPSPSGSGAQAYYVIDHIGRR
jgi:hypothetical protein